MQPRMLKLHNNTVNKLLRLRKASEKDGEYRVAKRIHAVLLNHQGNTSSSISRLLHSPRSRVSEWLKNYEQEGYESLLEGHRSGRPNRIDESQIKILADIIDSGPVAYGFLSGIWTSIMIAEVIKNEFAISYNPGHVRKILYGMNYSVQRPKRILVNADISKQNKWRRYIYPNIKKKQKASGQV